MGVPVVSKAAEWYGRKGYPVIPLHSVTPDGCTCGRSECESPGKHPLIIRWPENASRSAVMIRLWWNKWPEANVGIVTGAASGLVVLDVDVRHGGPISLEELESRCGELPRTVEAETGSGGRHILFRHPGKKVPNSAGLLGPGLDVRGDGGFIVAPPSLHACGRRYVWDPTRHPAHLEPALLPQWLLELLSANDREAVKPRPAGGLRSLVSKAVPAGRRNASLTRLAGYLLCRRVDPFVALGLLRSWNKQACYPPLSDDELVNTLNSISKAELRKRRGH